MDCHVAALLAETLGARAAGPHSHAASSHCRSRIYARHTADDALVTPKSDINIRPTNTANPLWAAMSLRFSQRVWERGPLARIHTPPAATACRAFMLDIAQAMHSSHQVGHKYPTYKYSKPLMDCHVASLLAETACRY